MTLVEVRAPPDFKGSNMATNVEKFNNNSNNNNTSDDNNNQIIKWSNNY